MSDIKYFKCDICGYSRDSKESTIVNLWNQSKKKMDTKFVCDGCNKQKKIEKYFLKKVKQWEDKQRGK